MTSNECSAFLKQFDFDPVSSVVAKETMLMAGSGVLAQLKLTTPAFVSVMEDMLTAMSYLHHPLQLKPLKEAGVNVTGYADRMLTHDWAANLLETALSQESWKASIDPLEDHKLADPIDSNAKRKKDRMDMYRDGAKKQRVNEGGPEDLEQIDSE